jgi:hypothetical protein
VNHLRDRRHNPVFGIFLMPLLRCIEVQPDASGKQRPRQQNGREPIRLSMHELEADRHYRNSNMQLRVAQRFQRCESIASSNDGFSRRGAFLLTTFLER